MATSREESRGRQGIRGPPDSRMTPTTKTNGGASPPEYGDQKKRVAGKRKSDEDTSRVNIRRERAVRKKGTVTVEHGKRDSPGSQPSLFYLAKVLDGTGVRGANRLTLKRSYLQ